MKEFDVFFPQVQYTCIRVTARNEESAKNKAKIVWQHDNAQIVPGVVKPVDE